MAAIHTTGSNEISEMLSTVMTTLLIRDGEMSQPFSKHCHNGSQLNVTESFLSDDSENAVEEFLRLVRKRMVAEQIATKKDR